VRISLDATLLNHRRCCFFKRPHSLFSLALPQSARISQNSDELFLTGYGPRVPLHHLTFNLNPLFLFQTPTFFRSHTFILSLPCLPSSSLLLSTVTMPATASSASQTIPSFLSTALLSINKLGDDNWVEWSENMEMFFMGVQMDWVTTGVVEAGQDKLDKALTAYIYTAMEPGQRYRIKGIKSATEAWTTLKSIYNKSTMGRRIRAREILDAIEHDNSRPMDFYIQTVTTGFEALKNFGEQISDTTVGDHILRHLHPSYHSVRTTILAQETEPSLAKIKAILLGSASSDTYIKSEPIDAALATRFGGSHGGGSGKEKSSSRQEPVTDGFREGKFTWCNKDNADGCHRCGRDGHISRLCARDMPSSIKELVLQGTRAHAARRAFRDLKEQESPESSDTEVTVKASTAFVDDFEEMPLII
jgi:gag-polypeptide of LTR copia-type